MKKRYLPIRIMKESFLYERKDFLLLLLFGKLNSHQKVKLD